MLTPTAKHFRRATWAITCLEAGALLFVAGLVVLYLNPYWHFDEGGFLDWRLRWYLASLAGGHGPTSWRHCWWAALSCGSALPVSLAIGMRTLSGIWPTASTCSGCKCGTKPRGSGAR